MIAGRNSYGTILIELNPNGDPDDRRVAFLDLHRRKVWGYGNSDLRHCIGNVFPGLKVPDFLDPRGFDGWIGAGNPAPDLSQCLAKRDNEGPTEASNFVTEDIVAAFESRCPS